VLATGFHQRGSDSGIPSSLPPPVDFSKYAAKELLGDGEAKQKLRELERCGADCSKRTATGAVDARGNQRLFDKDFVTKIELERDQLTYDKQRAQSKKGRHRLEPVRQI